MSRRRRRQHGQYLPGHCVLFFPSLLLGCNGASSVGDEFPAEVQGVCAQRSIVQLRVTNRSAALTSSGNKVTSTIPHVSSSFYGQVQGHQLA